MSTRRTSIISYAAPLLVCLLAGAAAAEPPRRLEQLALAERDVAGKPFDKKALAGRVVLVDVWATWCEPCRDSFPFYADLVRRFGAQGFAVVAVAVDRAEKKVRRFVRRMKAPFTVLHDPAGALPRSWAAAEMPTFTLYGRDGQPLLVHGGFEKKDREKIESAVSAALAAPAAAGGSR